jgi:N-acetylmuramic acid 6-phosphate etherase
VTDSGALAVELDDIPTEARNPRTLDLDLLPTLDVLRLINAEDERVPAAVAEVLPLVARATDLAVEALRGTGRIHYFGAGTSGRLAVIDAAELPPTYGIDPGRVVAHHAGGSSALSRAIEDVEDDAALGMHDAADVSAKDLTVGISASGRTPYVVGALGVAAAAGAATVLISSNPRAPFGAEVDVHIGIDTGPEVVTGSTRMKAGTATKLVLNSISTTAMVRLGYTYSNLMVSVNALNSKLRSRLVKILTEATGAPAEDCADALIKAGGDTRTALLMLLCGVSPEQAVAAMSESGGAVRQAMQLLNGARPRGGGDA